MTSQDGAGESELLADPALVAAAVAGDQVALQRLLLAHYDTLARRVRARLPPRLQATQAVEDILQLTFLQAFRDITRFEPRADATFGDWLNRIAENRLLDAIKQHDCEKRGGGWHRVGEGIGDESGMAPLLDWIASDDKSPSSVVARGEALQALQVALASLDQDQREALRLRLVEGKSLEETAAALGRTPDAIRGLIYRGKQELSEAMGRASQWLGAK
jgi:RNA polymerase sigma-70 factor (ECF subfamily)